MLDDETFKLKFDTISLPFEGEYAVWHKLVMATLVTSYIIMIIMKFSFHYLEICCTQLRESNFN